ncbi:MAG: Nif3-like dinuclear metal center hexameric protein [Saprospiraceae bacterium]
MIINDIIKELEKVAPPALQESYDNAGLIVGDKNADCKGAVLCLDSTEDVIEEAIKNGCNLVIAHHPIVFKGLKRFTGKNYVERTVMKAIKNDIAIYAIHTNLDNVLENGVNAKIAERLGLVNTRILSNKSGLKKAEVSCMSHDSSYIEEAMRGLGADLVSHSENEAKAQMNFTYPFHLQSQVNAVLAHYLADNNGTFLISTIENSETGIGSGLFGELKEPMETISFLKFLKNQMEAGVVKYTRPIHKEIRKVALCGGSGGFLLGAAKASGADVFITADYKYHEYFDADGDIIIADIGHYESEHFTKQLLFDILSDKFPNFALHLTDVNTNPVNYL